MGCWDCRAFPLILDRINIKGTLSHIYSYIRTPTHPYIYIYIYIRSFIHSFIHTYIHTYIYTCTNTSIHMYIHKFMHTYVHNAFFLFLSDRVCSEKWRHLHSSFSRERGRVRNKDFLDVVEDKFRGD